MAFSSPRLATEDIPLISSPVPSVVTSSSRSPDSKKTASVLFVDRPSNSIRSTIERKPLPARGHVSSSVAQNHPANRPGYSAVSGVEGEEEGNEPDRTVDDVKNSIGKQTIWSSRHGTLSAEAKDPEWLPYALRLPWLIGIITFGLLLLVLVVVSHYESFKHNGLVTDSGTSGIYFAWRFLPTLLAVSYVTMLMIVLDAVKYTEPFARLARAEGATAGSSILRQPGAWWTAVIDSIPGKQNGGRFSMAMLLASTAYILGLFGLSPFSSALLQVKAVFHSEPMAFRTVQMEVNSILSIQPDTLDFAQTMANALQNVTTSPWIAGGYVIVPFWPSQDNRPDGARIVNSGEQWEADTLVFKSEIEYEALQLVGNSTVMNWPYTGGSGNYTYQTSLNLTSSIFKTQAGCELGLGYLPSCIAPELTGGLFWSNLSKINTPECSLAGGDQAVLLNHTISCEPGEVLIMLPPANASWQPFGYLFRPKYYSATTSVTVIPDSDATIIRLDEDMFNKTRKPITPALINTTSFDEIFLSSQWSNFLTNPHAYGVSEAKRAPAGGPANVLAAMYDFQLSSLVQTGAVLTVASQLRQQFFGRVIQTFLQNISSTNLLDGEVLKTERRIVITSVVAIFLEVVLVVILCLLLVNVWCTRLSQRPLGVVEDTAFVNTITSMVPPTRESTMSMDGISLADVLHDRQKQKTVVCKVKDRKITTLPATSIILAPHEVKRHDDSLIETAPWTSGVLAGWLILLLAFFLCVLSATIATLYWYSIVHGLSQRAFTYQMTIEGDTHTIGRITPYAIIPTLLGVVTGLWWGSIDSVFRTVQPFIAMARRPTISARGSGLSYQSSYLAWASVRSMSRGHWLLALICTGAFLSQILTISMSALWQPVSSSVNSTQTLNQPFQLREVPRVYFATTDKATAPQQILPALFKNFTSNWLYGAFSQLTVNASEPSWSHDGWSFVPVSLDRVHLTQQSTNLPVGNAGANATVTVPAIRGRLECTSLPPTLGAKYYTSPVNISQYNATGRSLRPSDTYYEIGCFGLINFDPNVTSKYTCEPNEYYTTPLAADVPVACCSADENGLPENAIFSYWSPVLGGTSHDIIVKTLYGLSPAPYTRYSYGDEIYLLWPAIPSLTMLRCEPIIETATFAVTVDIATEKVQNSVMLDTPIPYETAWSDDYVTHQTPPGFDTRGSSNNYTLSFGPMFVSALLGASQVTLLGGCEDESGQSCVEQIDDQMFNYHAPGMNMDYMSYSMFALASKNISAMLDQDRMIPSAQKVFTTFFQHFVSNAVRMDGDGGWAYQRASETLPADLLPPYHETSNTNSRVEKAAPSTVTAIISEPIEKLQMSPVAVYLCLAILLWLLITTILIFLSKKQYLSPLLQPVETIADVARLVVHSDCYLELAKEKGATGLRKDKTFRTKLGWFRSRANGGVRWGIELADDPRVDWLDDEEIERLRKAREKK